MVAKPSFQTWKGGFSFVLTKAFRIEKVIRYNTIAFKLRQSLVIQEANFIPRKKNSRQMTTLNKIFIDRDRYDPFCNK